MSKILRRRVLIREYDFEKVKPYALSTGRYQNQITLYDRVIFEPLDQDTLEKHLVIDILKGNSKVLRDMKWDSYSPTGMLYSVKDHLYNTQYYQWMVTVDDQGYLCVQARSNTPKSRMGWATFEKDLDVKEKNVN